ncbi:hypothetical protein [Paenibacillus motobuensis]|uniref:Uncharacterized protein n=1 Tax=Paenibacillus motobuensis TaxID=295324 RepID=A0ABP3I4M3_9BACL
MGDFGQGAIEYMKRKQAGIYAVADNVAREAEGYMKLNAPWKDRLGGAGARGALHTGIEIKNKEKVLVYLAHGVRYGNYLEEGTPPHKIRANNKKVLAIPIETWNKDKRGPVNDHKSKQLPKLSKDGKFVILGRSVNHPGTKKRAIVLPTAKKYRIKLRDKLIKWWLTP